MRGPLPLNAPTPLRPPACLLRRPPNGLPPCQPRLPRFLQLLTPGKIFNLISGPRHSAQHLPLPLPPPLTTPLAGPSFLLPLQIASKAPSPRPLFSLRGLPLPVFEAPSVRLISRLHTGSINHLLMILMSRVLSSSVTGTVTGQSPRLGT